MADLTQDQLRNRREDYAKGELVEGNADSNPFSQLGAWIDVAQNDDEVSEPNAMTIATVDNSGKPRARVVLMRGFDYRGLEFYTNYESAKGRDLEINPDISAVFFWPSLQRQIRIDGFVEKVSASDSDSYFASRPYKSKLGALVSRQSSQIESRQVLEDNLEKLRATYPEDSPIPRPDNWGGYRIVPQSFEFWQGRRSRLHDRLLYQRDGDAWTRVRLAP